MVVLIILTKNLTKKTYIWRNEWASASLEVAINRFAKKVMLLKSTNIFMFDVWETYMLVDCNFIKNEPFSRHFSRICLSSLNICLDWKFSEHLLKCTEYLLMATFYLY